MEYQFRPMGKKCAGTGAELVPGSVCYSVVVEKNGEQERLDYSEAGWNGPPEGHLGYWQCVVPEPAAVKKNLYDPQALLSYFEQLTEDAQPVHERIRYILALLLLQKRVFHLDGSRRDGEDEYWQISGAQGVGAYEVRDLNITDDEEMHELQAELTARLAAEWG